MPRPPRPGYSSRGWEVLSFELDGLREEAMLARTPYRNRWCSALYRAPTGGWYIPALAAEFAERVRRHAPHTGWFRLALALSFGPWGCVQLEEQIALGRVSATLARLPSIGDSP